MDDLPTPPLPERTWWGQPISGGGKKGSGKIKSGIPGQCA